MPDKTRKEILKEVEEQIKETVKGLLERIMREERDLYLEEHPTKANGYYTRDLLTLVGPVGDLRVPACGKGASISKSSLADGVLPWSSRKPSSPCTPAG